MDKCCDTCGDVGAIDLIVTCSVCKSSYEHLYCMYAFPEVHPESWCCGRCEGFIKGSSSRSPGTAHRGSTLQTDIRQTLISRGTILQERRSMSNSQLVSGKPSQHSEKMRPPTAWQQVTQSSGGLRGGLVSPNLEIQLVNPLNVIPSSTQPLDDNRLYIPASDASWKGIFKVLLSDPKEREINCCIQAHPPSRVRRKVYAASKLMPEVLDCELVQRESLWTSLFENYSPNRRDIGLYFFPSNPEGCTNFISLLKHMKAQDLVLKKDMDGLELLIFTSEILPMDCKRIDVTEWKWEYLWGLFRHTKSAITSIPKEVHNDEGNNNEVTEIEIDMMGRENVGRSDIVVPRVPLQQPPLDINEEPRDDIPPRFETNVGRFVPRVPLQLPPLYINEEPCDDIPPRFETNVGRSDIAPRNTSSPATCSYQRGNIQ